MVAIAVSSYAAFLQALAYFEFKSALVSHTLGRRAIR